MSEHAKLSASGSERWILCPGSVKAEEGLPEKLNPYAEEGTLAHEVAAKILNGYEIEDDIPSDMLDNVKKYIDYIEKYAVGESVTYIEERVDFSYVAPGGFGTADCIISDEYNGILHIIDLKYGKGVPVYAEDNTQLELYAIGALNKLWKSNVIPCPYIKVYLHIVQPRINNYSWVSLTIEELAARSQYLCSRALEALKPDAKRIPSEKACKWCKAKPTCPAIYEFIDHNILPLQTKNSLNHE